MILPETDRRLRAIVAEAAGVDPSDVLVNCSHTHNGAATIALFGSRPDRDFLRSLDDHVRTAAAEAAREVEPVELRSGSAVTRGLTFNRRPLYAGDQARTHGATWDPDFVRHEGPADETLHVLVATRADGTVAGGMANFACHPHILAAVPILSADCAGFFVERLGERHDGVFLFLQGASGNLSWQDMSDPAWSEAFPALDAEEDAETAPWALPDVHRAVPLIERWAGGLLAAADDAIAASRPVEPGIRSGRRGIRITQRRPTAGDVELAFWYLAQPAGTVDDDEHNVRATGFSHTLWDNRWLQSQFAREVIALDDWQTLSSLEDPVDDVEISVLALGDVAFVGFPAEMFTEFGLRVNAESPFGQTIVCGLTNGWVGYVPTADAFGHGGYETRLATSSRLVPDAGDAMTEVALDLLADVARGRVG